MSSEKQFSKEDKQRMALVTFLHGTLHRMYPSFKAKELIMTVNYYLDNMNESMVTQEEVDIIADVMMKTTDVIMRLKNK